MRPWRCSYQVPTDGLPESESGAFFIRRRCSNGAFLQHYVGSFRYHSISENDTQAIDVDLREDVEQLYEQVDMFRGQ